MDNEKTPELLSNALKFGIKLGLDRMNKLMELLGNPQEDLKVVHVAGTNGKGSVCTYISSILANSGLKVGVFTSPYLERFSERMRIIDGREGLRAFVNDDSTGEIDGESLEKVLKTVEEASNQMVSEGYENPTEFELVTAMCFVWFSQMNVDVAVLEVGLGGRLVIGDRRRIAVNIDGIHADVAVCLFEAAGGLVDVAHVRVFHQVIGVVAEQDGDVLVDILDGVHGGVGEGIEAFRGQVGVPEELGRERGEDGVEEQHHHHDGHGQARGSGRRQDDVIHYHQEHEDRSPPHQVDIYFRHLPESPAAVHTGPAYHSTKSSTEQGRKDGDIQRCQQSVDYEEIAILNDKILLECVNYPAPSFHSLRNPSSFYL
mgnify:CR=1 FL=1